MSIKKVKSKRFKSGHGYLVTIDRKGLRFNKTYPKLETAKQIHDALLGRIALTEQGIPVASNVTLKKLIDTHLASMKKSGRDKLNTRRAETILHRFRDLVGGSRMVESIRTADLKAYVNNRLEEKKPPKPQSINRELAEIKGCLTAAGEHFGNLQDWRSPKAPWLGESHDGRRQTWTDEQIASVLRELYAPKQPKEQDWHVRGRHTVGDMFVVSLLTGLRAGETRNLRKFQIDFSKRLILVVSKKGIGAHGSARIREVPMVDEVFEILKRRFDRATGEYLFPGRDPLKPITDHRKAFIHACERAKVPYGLNGGGSLIFNDARRTAENKMLDAGQSPRAVADIQGHSYETMARHYARSTAESRRSAIEHARLKNFGAIFVVENEKLGQLGQLGNQPEEKKTPADQQLTETAGDSEKS